jgi:hypothetical protein
MPRGRQQELRPWLPPELYERVLLDAAVTGVALSRCVRDRLEAHPALEEELLRVVVKDTREQGRAAGAALRLRLLDELEARLAATLGRQADSLAQLTSDLRLEPVSEIRTEPGPRIWPAGEARERRRIRRYVERSATKPDGQRRGPGDGRISETGSSRLPARPRLRGPRREHAAQGHARSRPARETGGWAGTHVWAIRYGHLEDWRSAMAKRGLGPKSVQNVLGAFHVMLRWLLRRGDLRVVPEFPTIPTTDYAPKIITRDAQDRILEAIPWKARGVFLAMAHTLRPGEARAVEIRDYRDGDLIVRRAVKGRHPESEVREGHKDRKSTDRYAKLADRTVVDAMRRRP